MDRWKAEMGRVREKRRVEERRSEKRKSQKKEDADARKGRKVAEHCVFPVICGAGGSKSRLAKAAGAEPSGQMRDWTIARRCGAKHMSKSKCTKHTILGSLLEVEMSKKCTPLRREDARSTFASEKKLKTPDVRTTFGSWDVEKVHAVVARSKFGSQNVQNTTCSRHFRKFRCRFAWQAQWTLSKVSRTWGFCSISKNDGKHGTFEQDLQRCISRGRRNTRGSFFIRAVRRSGRWFREKGCILEHQIFRFAEMILRDRCSTSYDLASLFRCRRRSLDRWTGKIAKRIGTRLSALHATFHFWRRSRRIASFLTLLSSKNHEVSQNCFVSDVVKFENEDISQNSVVFKLAGRQADRQRERDREIER